MIVYFLTLLRCFFWNDNETSATPFAVLKRQREGSKSQQRSGGLASLCANAGFSSAYAG